MGWNTFLTIGKPLPGRLNIVYTPEPEAAAKQYKFSNLEFTDEKPDQLIKDLESRGHKEVAICGGATIYTMFMQAKLVSRIYLTIEPVIFGQGIRLFNQAIPEVKLELMKTDKLGEEGTVLLEYKVSYV